ncbi:MULTISPECIES: hypothetical protein [unclassified Treponema]|uniref:hypothetical protein n=1 Tax=unclassified Treponema TaxID=2638727 RepID=UPI0025D6D441|nr:MULTISPECIES: hypothetical protein [unclassified Treponema]
MTAISKSVNNQFSDRVLELRRKIHDSEYVDFAVQRIAQVLSRKLVEDSETVYDGRKHGTR